MTSTKKRPPLSPERAVAKIRALLATVEAHAGAAADEAREHVRQRALERQAAILARVPEVERPMALRMLAAALTSSPQVTSKEAT